MRYTWTPEGMVPAENGAWTFTPTQAEIDAGKAGRIGDLVARLDEAGEVFIRAALGPRPAIDSVGAVGVASDSIVAREGSNSKQEGA
jgi:hypothetical protein